MVVRSNSPYLQQLYTGFFMLFKHGLIDLDQEIIPDKKENQDNQDSKHFHLNVTINDCIKVNYDTKDGWPINPEMLESSDYYFKRSFSPKLIERLGVHQKKIFPLGMNYAVFPNGFDKFAFQRHFVLSRGVQKAASALRQTFFFNHFRFTPRLSIMQSFPDYTAPPKIIFMVKAFDPYDMPGRSEEQIEERQQINGIRANCIKMLRAEFGKDFHGGFYHTAYSIKNYGAYLMPDRNHSTKQNYLKLLKSFPICIANSGLHGSIGWKFAEYIAFSKAIVAERIKFTVPGNLEAGKNYLEFASAGECVEKAVLLYSNRELRHSLMLNNSIYYHSFLRPDALVLNTIMTALTQNALKE